MRAGGSNRPSISAMSRSVDVRDFLADELAVGCDTNQHLPPSPFRKAQERLAGGLQLGG